MSLKGNLASVNLTEIFQMLSLSGREGTLFIYEGARKRAICFTKEGVSIRSRERNESNLLGKILVRLGKITEDDLASAVESKRSTNRLLGDTLVEAGACTHGDIDEAFSVQSQEDIQELFLTRSDAQFEYVDGYFPENEAPFTNLNVNALLIEIARRTDEWEYIRRRIRGPREIYRFTGQEGEVDADVLEDCYAPRIDAQIDGARSVGDIIDDSYVNKFHVCKLLAAYLDAGVIEPVPVDAIRQNARLALRMGDAAGAIRHYEYLMSAGDFTLEVMAEAAEAHETNRDYTEATALYRRLAEEHVRDGNERIAIEVLRRIANYPRPEADALRYLLDLVFANPRIGQEFSAHITEAGKTLAAHYIRCDQRPEAQDLLEKLLELFPEEIAFAVSLVNLHYDQGNIDRAASECERMANSFLKRKLVTPAVSLYKKLLVIDPERQDIRDKIRRVVAGKRTRKRGPSALARALVAVAVALLMGGAAIVYVRHGGAIMSSGESGLDAENRLALTTRAQSEAAIAGANSRNATRELARLEQLVGSGPIENSEQIAEGLTTVHQNIDQFRQHSKSALDVLRELRGRLGEDGDATTARALEASIEAQTADVDLKYSKWVRRAEQTAKLMKDQGELRYEEGKLKLALERFELARLLGDSDWVADSNLDAMVGNIRGDMDKVDIKRREASALEGANRLVDARYIIIALVSEFGEADLISDLLLPREIVTQPPGATVRMDGKELPSKTPCVVRMTPFAVTKIVLSRKGYLDHVFSQGPFGRDTNPDHADYIVQLKKKPTWTYPLGGGRIDSRPAIWKGRAAFISRDGHWAILDAKTGKRARSRKHNRPLSGHVPNSEGFTAGMIAAGDRAYAVSLDRKLYSFDLNDGKARAQPLPWFRDSIYVAPILIGDILYIVDKSGTVIALNRKTRELAWPKPVETSHGVVEGLDPVVIGSDLVITTRDGNVTVLSLKDGSVLLRFEVKGPLCCTPSPVGNDRLVFASESGLLQCFTSATGQDVWPYDLKSAVKRSLPVRVRAVFASPRPLELIAIDHLTGQVTAHYRPTRANARAQVAATERMFFVHGRGLTAYAATRDSYAPAWTFEAEGVILAGPTEADGAVFIADEKGVIYRLEANDE